MHTAWDPEPTGELDLDVAYADGYEAAIDLEDLKAIINLCPYNTDTLHAEKWHQGYQDRLSDMGLVD